jgi:hypothetical protein
MINCYTKRQQMLLKTHFQKHNSVKINNYWLIISANCRQRRYCLHRRLSILLQDGQYNTSRQKSCTISLCCVWAQKLCLLQNLHAHYCLDSIRTTSPLLLVGLFNHIHRHYQRLILRWPVHFSTPHGHFTFVCFHKRVTPMLTPM